MRILLTNDDGVASPALDQLRRVLSPFGRVITIAPDRNQSASSQSLTLHRPLRIQELAEDRYSVDGTPTDCVLVAFHGQLKGVKLTRLGTRLYADTLVRKVDPRGKDYFWIGGEDPVWQPNPGTDFHSVHGGHVSVTPLRLELTDHEALADMQGWGLAL